VLFLATELSGRSRRRNRSVGHGLHESGAQRRGDHRHADGANIEIREQVGEENLFVFGHTAEEIATLSLSTSPRDDPPDPELDAVIDRIASMSGGIFQPIVDILRGNDRYFHCADFASYVETQKRAAEAWMDRERWTRMSILNTARSGYFSADRTVAEYAKKIWLSS
jgi:starch phosphorylase